MEGKSCIFTENPFLGECIYDDTDDNNNLKGKDRVNQPVSMEVIILNQFPTTTALYNVTFISILVIFCLWL